MHGAGGCDGTARLRWWQHWQAANREQPSLNSSLSWRVSVPRPEPQREPERSARGTGAYSILSFCVRF